MTVTKASVMVLRFRWTESQIGTDVSLTCGQNGAHLSLFLSFFYKHVSFDILKLKQNNAKITELMGLDFLSITSAFNKVADGVTIAWLP